jgi:hypothetical protein
LGWEPSVEFIRKEIRDGLRSEDGAPKTPPDLPERYDVHALDAIRQLLRDDWDPIDLMPHLPADEYDTYAMQVFSKLKAGASAQTVAHYLGDVDMGDAPDPERDLRVAEKAMLIMSRSGQP